MQEMMEEAKKKEQAEPVVIPVLPPSLPTPSEEVVNVAGIKVTLKYIPSGTYQMGCMAGDKACDDDEKPAHKVTIAQGFYMMQTEVTQGLYQAVMGKNPSSFTACGLECPVEQVSWEEAKAFSGKVSGLVGGTWSLPTEEQWEWAARGGQEYVYAGSNTLGDVGWYDDNSGNTTHPVKQKKANAFGLYDMSGNVWEWTESVYAPYPGATWAREDDRRVLRGGSWNYVASITRISNRVRNTPNDLPGLFGFRLVRSIPQIKLVARAQSEGGDIDVEEGDAGNITTVMKKNSARIRTCTERAAKTNPNVKGRVSVTFNIVTGKVSSAKLVANQTGDVGLGDCVVKAVRSFRFDASVTGTVDSYSWIVSTQ